MLNEYIDVSSVLSVFTLIVFPFSYRLIEVDARWDEPQAENKPTQDRHNDQISSQVPGLFYLWSCLSMLLILIWRRTKLWHSRWCLRCSVYAAAAAAAVQDKADCHGATVTLTLLARNHHGPYTYLDSS